MWRIVVQKYCRVIQNALIILHCVFLTYCTSENRSNNMGLWNCLVHDPVRTSAPKTNQFSEPNSL